MVPGATPPIGPAYLAASLRHAEPLGIEQAGLYAVTSGAERRERLQVEALGGAAAKARYVLRHEAARQQAAEDADVLGE